MKPNPLKYRDRSYRNRISTGNLLSFRVQVQETDLWIRASKDLSHEALNSVYQYRLYIEKYIQFLPDFQTSFIPLEPDPLAPQIVQDMLEASRIANVGPMASVAGAIADFVGRDLIKYSDEVIVENGGDIFIKTNNVVNIGIFAGESPLSHNLSLVIRPEDTPTGVCTSSATVGHSISLGRADAVSVISKSATLADAAATAVGNTVKSERDIRKSLELGMMIPGVLGVVIVIGDKLGVLGSIEIA